MITQIDISNFKIHDDTRLRVAPLTILTGVNGMGKSSVTQAMLMFVSQSFRIRPHIRGRCD